MLSAASAASQGDASVAGGTGPCELCLIHFVLLCVQVKCHACVGGTSVREDTRILQAGVHVVVGTPGACTTCCAAGPCVHSMRMFVLDEADEMLAAASRTRSTTSSSCCRPSCRSGY